MGTPPPAPAPPDAECPRCGTPYAPRQEYCLECGIRLPTRGIVATLASGWRRRVRWYPGDWIWPALAGLVVAAIATAVVVAATWGNGGGSTIVATGPTRTGSVTTVGTTTPTSTPNEPTTAPTSPAPPPPAATTGPISWPAGKSGFTVVLESIPAASGRAAALARARAALRAGLKDVGILDSSQYPSLHAGYYVVFSGIYASNVDATSAAASAKASGYADAYPAAITS
jgi:hypothetical protein